MVFPPKKAAAPKVPAKKGAPPPFVKGGKPAAPMPPKGPMPFAKGGAVKKSGRGC